MTLAVGTTLQHGIYVIDAWIAEDIIGPVYLAMHVPTGQWMQLRVLGSRSPERLPDGGDRQAFYHYLEQVNGLRHPALPALLGGFEEEGVCYQTLASPRGVPLAHLVTPTAPLSPRRSLAIVRQLIDLLEVLRPFGWAGLQLTPDQVWYADGDQSLSFTGFDLATPQPAAAEGESLAAAEAPLVRGLSQLLYFLLTGHRAEATQAPLSIDVRRLYPALPTSLDTALEVGSPRIQPQTVGTVPAERGSAERGATETLTAWAALLPAIADLPPDIAPVSLSTPPATLPTVLVTPPNGSVPLPPPGSQPDSRSLPPRPPATARSIPAVALVLTGLVASLGGLGLGFHARLQPASSPHQERLNPNQAFPPLPNWSGDTLWQPWEDAPTLRSRPDYGAVPPGPAESVTNHSPNPQEPAAPPPAVTQSELAEPEPSPNPAESEKIPFEPWPQSQPDSTPADSGSPDPILPEVDPPQSPLAPPAPLEAPPPSQPTEAADPPPLNTPPRLSIPAPLTN